jgi:uncharacterized protein (TIGR03000 family)
MENFNYSENNDRHAPDRSLGSRLSVDWICGRCMLFALENPGQGVVPSRNPTMRQVLALLLGYVLIAIPAFGDEVVFPDGSTPRQNGGLMIIRQGNQTTISLGGALFARRVKVTTATPEGPVVTRFQLPSPFHNPHSVPLPQAAPAFIRVEIPDDFGLLYVEGELLRTHGTVRQLQSPDLPPGMTYPLHLRSAFKVGNNLLIEDKQVLIRAGEATSVTFAGERAVSVSLP